MWKWLGCLILFLALTTSASASKAYVIDINGAIGPATVDYVKRGLATAEKNQANFFLIRLNTPGGLESSMRDINQAIINSTIPVITYVAPAGARAASAGTFIMYASHIAAMAPGTNIGAATPVNLAQTEHTKETSSDLKSKNDAAAYIRSLAQLHGRNVEWGENAVQKAATLSANEAKKLKVINEVAPDTPSLLKQLDGKTVVIKGKVTTIDTKKVDLVEIKTDWRYDLLSFITNPNIAYLLMLIAIYGLFFEFSNPGLVLPGVVGVIALVLALYAFQLMPINYVGLTLILIGLVFLIFEVYVSSFGLIGLGGVFAFIIGSIMLFDVNDPNYQITWTLIFAMSAITVTFFFVLFSLAIRSHKRAIVTGQEGLIGSEGVVLSSMNDQMIVKVLGEIWRAKSNHSIDVGETVRVRGVQGLTLFVERTRKEKK